jgi:DNA repair exonuclease SbcCD nuclease subunit
MRIALINDTHAGARGDNPHLNDFFFRFWDTVFFPALKTHNVDRIVHLGDVVDRRKFINFAIWYKWKEDFFDKLEAMKMPMDMLTGNHDVYYRNTNKVNALSELLGKYSNITVYQEPETVTYDGLQVALIPWINSGNHDAAMKFIQATPAPIIFGHLEVAGFEMDRGVICLEGHSRTLFDRFDMVLSGHFHHKSSDGTIHYLGNQYQITWADYEDTRGFHIFDTETRELSFIENPYRLFHKLVYNDSTQNFEYWNNQDLASYANSYVKVVVEQKQNPYLFSHVMDALYKVTPIDVTVVEDHTEFKANTAVNTVNQAEDTPSIIRKSVDGMKIPASVESDKLKALLQELYMEALNEMAAQ